MKTKDTAPLQALPNESRAMTAQALRRSFQETRTLDIAKDEHTATTFDNFTTLALVVRDRLMARWSRTQQSYHKRNLKRVYYLSMEFMLASS